MNEDLEYIKIGHTIYLKSYIDELERIRDNANYYSFLICKAWNGESFGQPGWGSKEFVKSQLALANVAAITMLSVINNEKNNE